MPGFRCLPDTELTIEVMTDPAIDVRFDAAGRGKILPSSRGTLPQTSSRISSRLSGLPRMGQAIIDGEVKRR